ncbi:right-handed parallel beta-helix repeat-containing protein, partial [Candidatus Bathyarchaeota archaeon]|nr:right-handed parallel beta-helix repeat-containing protein [Candidatus Bathyarchaeota archaeon]
AAANDPDVAIRRTGLCRIADNEISAAGRIFHSGVGVLSMNAFQMAIVHNHIHDLFYTGVSCGWEWGYHQNVSRDNLIAWNHIHDIGQGLLSDMGGIYTLGVQPGTVLRGNLIHDVHSAHYGGWCIYPDEGSSHILIEHNVCYDADRNAFHQHYGRENVIRNNIFAFGGEAVCTYSRKEPHRGFTFMRNILVTSSLPLWNKAQSDDAGSLEPEKERILCDLNLIFDTDAAEPTIHSRDRTFSLAAWREAGLDLHSLVADPGFADLEKRDFSLAADSPVFTLGFEPIDLSQVGPR